MNHLPSWTSCNFHLAILFVTTALVEVARLLNVHEHFDQAMAFWLPTHKNTTLFPCPLHVLTISFSYRTPLAGQRFRSSALSMAPDTRLEASAPSSVSTFSVLMELHTT